MSSQQASVPAGHTVFTHARAGVAVDGAFVEGADVEGAFVEGAAVEGAAVGFSESHGLSPKP